MFFNEPEPANALVSHAQLLLEYDRASEIHEGWSNFLQRAQTRALKDTSTVTVSTYEPQEALRTLVGKVPIWKVAVKVCFSALYVGIKAEIPSSLAGKK